MNIFKYTSRLLLVVPLLVVPLLALSSTTLTQDSINKTIKEIYFRVCKPGIATSGYITRCIKTGRPEISLYNSKNECLLYCYIDESATLNEIKALATVAGVDTSNLLYVKDYTRGNWWTRTFGRKIRA